MKHYGIPDTDPTALNQLLTLVNEGDISLIMHYPLIPINARVCQRPGSRKVSAILKNNKVISVIKYSDNTTQVEKNYT